MSQRVSILNNYKNNIQNRYRYLPILYGYIKNRNGKL